MLTSKLDILADSLESRGFIKESHDLDVVSNTIEAGMGQWLRNVVSKIPGLPSKEEALKTVGTFLKNNSQKFDQVVKDINEHLDMLSTVELHNRYAFDIKTMLSNIKSIADPKVILSIIALMGMFQTADAGKLRDEIRQINANYYAQQKIENEQEKREHEIQKEERANRGQKQEDYEYEQEEKATEVAQKPFQSSYAVQMTKDSLYNGVKQWVTSNVQSARIIMEQSGGSGASTITCKGMVTLPMGGYEKAVTRTPTKVPFTMQVTVEDGKYRVSFSEFSQIPSYHNPFLPYEGGTLEGPLVTEGPGSVDRGMLDKELNKIGAQMQSDLAKSQASRNS